MSNAHDPARGSKPKITRRRDLDPGMARTSSQQVKVSAIDRNLIGKLARLDGVTPSTWCYRFISAAIQENKDRIPNAELTWVEPVDAPADAPAPSTEAPSTPPAPSVDNGALAYS